MMSDLQSMFIIFNPLDEGHPGFVINEVISGDVALARTPAEAK